MAGGCGTKGVGQERLSVQLSAPSLCLAPFSLAPPFLLTHVRHLYIPLLSRDRAPPDRLVVTRALCARARSTFRPLCFYFFWDACSSPPRPPAPPRWTRAALSACGLRCRRAVVRRVPSSGRASRVPRAAGARNRSIDRDSSDCSSLLSPHTKHTHAQDADYPARELLYHNPQTRGWHSARSG